MRLVPSAALAAVLTLAAAGCTRAGQGDPPAVFVPPPATTQSPVVPRVPGTRAQLDVPTATDGIFRLVEAGGARLPAPMNADSCAPRLVAGTLGLSGNRYSLSLTTQAVCGTATAPRAQRGEGRLEITESTARLAADSAGVVQGGVGVFQGTGELRLVEITLAGETRAVQWRFVRDRGLLR